MSTKQIKEAKDPRAELWKERYQRQKLLIGSITSLLNKYGSSVDIDHLHNSFLLTLMGHYVVGDACYYEPQVDSTLKPQIVYGSMPQEDHPVIRRDCSMMRTLDADHSPRLLSTFGLDASGPEMVALRNRYEVVAPLYIRRRLVGLLLLGGKVSGQPYNEFDFEVLYALCAASATTFNNALLYHNARLSAREIEKLFRVRSELIDRVTHEFRTPLTSIRGCAEIIASGETGPKTRAILSDSVDRLEELIESLLKLNRNDSQGSDLQDPFDPSAVLQRTVSRFAERARDKQLRVVVNRDTREKTFHPLVSESNMALVFEALLDNAIKFSSESTMIEVSVAWSLGGPGDNEGAVLPDWRKSTQDIMGEYFDVTESIELDSKFRSFLEVAEAPRETVTPKRFLVVRVKDQGLGIPEDEIALISEPFRQASNSPDRGIKGRGLGLAIVQKVVSNTGGYVTCQSGEGVGTTMSVYFPCA